MARASPDPLPARAQGRGAGPSAAPRGPSLDAPSSFPPASGPPPLGGLTPPSRHPIASPHCPPAHLSNPEFTFERDTRILLKKPKDLARRASCPGVAGAHAVAAASPPRRVRAQVLPTRVAPLLHFLALPGPTGTGVRGKSAGPRPKSLHSVGRLHPQTRRSGGQSGGQMQQREPGFGSRKIWVHSDVFHPGNLRQIITFCGWKVDSEPGA